MMMKLLLKTGTPAALVIAGSLFCGSQAFAQLKIGDNPTSINGSAVLDIESTTKGILYPRIALTDLSLASPLASHVEGMHIYNTTTDADKNLLAGVYYNDGSSWVRLADTYADQVYEYGPLDPPVSPCIPGHIYINDDENNEASSGKQWVCKNNAWISYTPPSTTPFYSGINPTKRVDVGAAKRAPMWRAGAIKIQRGDQLGSSYLTPGGTLSMVRNLPADPANGPYIQFSNNKNLPNKFSIRYKPNQDVLAIQAVDASNVDRIRFAVRVDGSVGIGTFAPERQLHVTGPVLVSDAGATGNIALGNSSKDGIILGYDATGGATNVAIQNSTFADPVLVLTKKVVGLGASGANRYVDFRENGGVDPLGNISRNAAGVSFNATSDRRLKENIRNTHFSVLDLMKIEVKDYNYIRDKTKTSVTGFIAQDLYRVFPNAVTVGDDEKTNPWMVDYGKVTPLLVKAIQDQQKEIAALKAQLLEMNSLKEEVASIKSLLGKAEMIKDMPAK